MSGDRLHYLIEKERYLSPYVFKFCNQFIKKHPMSSEAFWDRAEIFMEKKDYSKAIKDLTSAIGIDKNSYFYSSRARAYIKLKKYQEAIKDLKESVRFKKEIEQKCFSMIDLADCYRQAGYYKRAIKVLKSAFKGGLSTTYSACSRIAVIYASCKKAEIRDGKKAIFYANKTIKLGRKLPQYNNNRLKIWNLALLAAAHAQSGQFKKAINLQKKVIFLVKSKHEGNKERIKQLEQRLDLYTNKSVYVRADEESSKVL